MKRVVTGHKDGKSVFVSEGTPPRIVKLENVPGSEFIEIWATDEEPVIPVGPGDPTVDMSSFVPGPGGRASGSAKCLLSKSLFKPLRVE